MELGETCRLKLLKLFVPKSLHPDRVTKFIAAAAPRMGSLKGCRSSSQRDKQTKEYGYYCNHPLRATIFGYSAKAGWSRLLSILRKKKIPPHCAYGMPTAWGDQPAAPLRRKNVLGQPALRVLVGSQADGWRRLPCLLPGHQHSRHVEVEQNRSQQVTLPNTSRRAVLSCLVLYTHVQHF
jgi:hypothetical protein